MKCRSIDTAVEAQQLQWKILRKLTPSQRMKMVFDLTEELHSITIAGIKNRHPEYSDEQVKQAFQKILWGSALYAKVYPECESAS